MTLSLASHHRRSRGERSAAHDGRRQAMRSLPLWVWLALLTTAVGCGGEDRPAADTTNDTGGGGVVVFDAGPGGGGDAAGSGDAAVDANDTTRQQGDASAGDTTGSGGGFDVTFPTGDAACVPQCSGKACGPDGCGAVCGFCPTGKVCAADGSACKAFCKPDCSAKKCGDNGCGGSCGDCPKDYGCGVDFICHKNDCTPSCALAGGGTKKCGSDGCGGTCGSCAVGDLCDDAKGVCSPTACKGIPEKGQCDGDLWVRCEGTGATGKKVVTDCSQQQPAGDQICAYDPTAGAYGCVKKPDCTPQCTTKDGQAKECGGDGCGGTCGGGCTAGWACPGGFCEAQVGATCGPLFPPAGECKGSAWLFCSSKVIQALDCSKTGQKCGWIAAAKSFGCK